MKMPLFSLPSTDRLHLRAGLWLCAALFAAASPARAEDTITSKVVDAETHSVTETISDSHGKLQKKTVLFFATDDFFAKDNVSTGAVHYNTNNTIRYKESYLRDPKGVMQ